MSGAFRLWWVFAAVVAGLLFAACSDDEVENTSVAVLFVGHGEPAFLADGDAPITLAEDGSAFGPFGVSLGVPEDRRSTEWAAAYEEISTAMTYIYPDLNQNGILHELQIAPTGDVPPFFTWDAFQESAAEYYEAVGGHSPHNDSLAAHVATVDVDVAGVDADIFLAYLDAVPRIPNAVWEITQTADYEKFVVVPMLLSSSTHTQEIVSMVSEAASMTAGMDLVLCDPLFESPYMRERIKEAILAMIEYVAASLPADVADDQIGVLLTAHGTPYVPADAAYGWQEGEIFSDLPLTEDAFHEEIGRQLRWDYLTGRMNWDSPSIEDSLGEFEAAGKTHVIVVPSAFPTAAIHTMWDVAQAAMGRAVQPAEGVVVHTRPSGMAVHYSSEGYADLETGRAAYRTGLDFVAERGVMELMNREARAAPYSLHEGYEADLYAELTAGTGHCR